MRITYVLPYPELNGGNKVIFQHVRLLQERGHELAVLAGGPKPDWIPIAAAWHDYSAGPPRTREADLFVATYWTTIPLARRLGLRPLAHFCQGYEGGLAHLAPQLAEIEEAYSLKLPTLTVSPHLGHLLRARFGRESVVVPPPLDPLFRPAFRLRPRREPWIAIPGIFAAEVKGVPVALEAVRLLRQRGIACRVLRFSILPLCDEERRLLAPDRYLCGVHPREIAAALRECDLLFLPSRAEEGFGLPLLEAMAARVPAVASRIPSTALLAEGAAQDEDTAVPLVPPGDAAAFAAAAGELLTRPRAWRLARRRGAQAASRYRPEAVAPLLDSAVRWARAQAVESPVLPMETRG